MSSYVLQYHELINVTKKAYLVRFNIQSRTRSKLAVCFDLGNCSTYPMWSSQQAFDENKWMFGSEYSRTTNLYEATKLINHDVWFPISQVKIDEKKRHITIPDWLLSNAAQKVFATKLQTDPSHPKNYPWHVDLHFRQMIRTIFQVKFIPHEISYGSSYEDDPWMSNGIGSHHMQD